ncbi:hypothetical protein WDU94_001770 [Cyamophila willieti]
MTSSTSKRSCPIRQLSLQQDVHTKRTLTMQKQKSQDFGGPNYVKLQINNTKFPRSLTPDMKSSRPSRPAHSKVNPIHQPKPKPIKIAWSDKKSISLNNSGQDEEIEADRMKVQVIAKKCKEVPRPFTAKPKVELETKSTILYTKEELADRLKLAIKDRQSRKQNLDIFLAQNVNNDQPALRSTSELRIHNLDNIDQKESDQFNEKKFETNLTTNVMDFHPEATAFVPYEDSSRVTKYGSTGVSQGGYQKCSKGEETHQMNPKGCPSNCTSSSSPQTLCDNCKKNCTENSSQKFDCSEDNGSYFLMASSPCLHRDEDHQSNELLKFKDMFNIEKQRPFSVRVINDKIDIFNDDEENDSLLLMDSDDNGEDSLTSSIEIDDQADTSIVPNSNSGLPSSSEEFKKGKFQNMKSVNPEVRQVETPPIERKLSASVRRNIFKNSSERHKNNNSVSLTAKRSRLARMSSAPSAQSSRSILKKQTTISGNNSQVIVKPDGKTGGGQKTLKDLVIPTISIIEDDTEPTNESKTTDKHDSINETNKSGEVQNNKLDDKAVSRKPTERSNLILRKQMSMLQFSSEDLEQTSQYHSENSINHTSAKRMNDIKDKPKASCEDNKIETENSINNENKPDPNTFPILANKFTIQRQNSRSNKISFQSTLSNYMKNETNIMKPILTNSNYDIERTDRAKSAALANKKKLKFSKKKFHKSLDDLSYEQEGNSNSKRLTKIPIGREVVTMVSLLSDESDVECDTPEPPCNIVVHHAPIMQPAHPAEDAQTKHQPVSTFQVCLRKPLDKPVTLPVQTSSSGRNYSTLYPSRRGPGFDSSNTITPPFSSVQTQLHLKFLRRSDGNKPV